MVKNSALIGFCFLLFVGAIVNLGLKLAPNLRIQTNNPRSYALVNAGGIAKEEKTTTKKKHDYFLRLEVPKINLKRELYQINDKRNNVNRNLEVLKMSALPNQANSLIVIAGHSGTSWFAYFAKLDEMVEGDELILYYQQVKYIYQVNKILIQKKNGQIVLSENKESQLVLTTCHPKSRGEQLILVASLIN